MDQKIYVGNLPYDTSSDDLESLFSEFGQINEVKLIVDHATGRSKGFGFITFDTSEAANGAQKLNGTELNGRQIRVSPANDNRGGGGGGRRQGGFRGNGRGDNNGNRGNYGNHNGGGNFGGGHSDY